MVAKTSVSSTELVILFRTAFRRFSTEAYTSTWRCCSGRNWTKNGVHQMREKKQLPSERLHLTCGQLQLLTSNELLPPAKLNYAPVYEGVRCGRQQSEAARNNSRGVFVKSKLRPSSPKKLPKSQNDTWYFVSHAGASTMATSPIKERLSPKVRCSPGGCFLLLLGRTW